MRAVFQRVYEASVTVDGEVVGAIGKGALLLVGVTHEDTEKEAKWLASKIAGLRVFSDSEDRMNLSVKDIEGGLLVVSNFTLYGNASHGRRPEFTAAARPEVAKPLFDTFVRLLKEEGVPVETGVFGADMTVSMQGNGPVTLWIDTATDARGL